MSADVWEIFEQYRGKGRWVGDEYQCEDDPDPGPGWYPFASHPLPREVWDASHVIVWRRLVV